MMAVKKFSFMAVAEGIKSSAQFPQTSSDDVEINRVTLHEEFRLIERSESEVNGAWKGAHLLLFFLAFVFGSFCTFCFHMLMYLFDEKCVLFPKLLSLTTMKQSILNSFLAEDEDPEAMPVDFVSTQWVDKSACYLPTYVPLVSGIFGLVWTTMFLMCSSGSRTLTGLQQPWRIIPPVFIFSLAMGCLCTYTSIVTYNGLEDLCLKLGEITGTKTCTFAVNVATLAYERRIRGVYQATRLTIFTAWMHTACWLLAALLALVRVLLVVDFRLVRVRAELRGNIDKMLERHEQHLRTVSPDIKSHDESTSTKPKTPSPTSVQIRFKNQSYQFDSYRDIGSVSVDSLNTIHYIASVPSSHTNMALLPEEQIKLDHIKARNYRSVIQILDDLVDSLQLSLSEGSPESSPHTKMALLPEEQIKLHHIKARNYRLVIRILDDLLESLQLISSDGSSASFDLTESESFIVRQQVGQRRISLEQYGIRTDEFIEPEEAEERAKAFRQQMQKKIPKPTPETQTYESDLNITPDLQRVMEQRNRPRTRRRSKKSNLKSKGNQTEIKTKSKSTQQKVKIADSPASEETLKPWNSEAEILVDDEAVVPTDDQVVQTQGQETMDKKTQTPKKVKQD